MINSISRARCVAARQPLHPESGIARTHSSAPRSYHVSELWNRTVLPAEVSIDLPGKAQVDIMSAIEKRNCPSPVFADIRSAGATKRHEMSAETQESSFSHTAPSAGAVPRNSNMHSKNPGCEALKLRALQSARTGSSHAVPQWLMAFWIIPKASCVNVADSQPGMQRGHGGQSLRVFLSISSSCRSLA